MDPSMLCVVQEGVLFDAGMLTWVLKRTCPSAHKHLQHHGVEPLMFATDWLMCLFTRHLPFNTLLRVWDLFFCYGKADKSHVLYGFPKGKATKLMCVNVIIVLYWSSSTWQLWYGRHWQCTWCHLYLWSSLCRGAGAAPGGRGACASGAGSCRAEEAVPGPDGDAGEAERCQGAGPRRRRCFHNRGNKLEW